MNPQRIRDWINIKYLNKTHLTKILFKSGIKLNNVTAKDIVSMIVSIYEVDQNQNISDDDKGSIISNITKDFNKSLAEKLEEIGISRKKEDNIWYYYLNDIKFEKEENIEKLVEKSNTDLLKIVEPTKQKVKIVEKVNNKQPVKKVETQKRRRTNKKIVDVNLDRKKLQKRYKLESISKAFKNKVTDINISIKTEVKGDYCYISDNGINIIDMKNYIGIKGYMNFPNIKENQKNYTKTIDSRLKREISILKLLNQTDKYDYLLEALNKLTPGDSEKIKFLNKKDLTNLISFSEFGLIYLKNIPMRKMIIYSNKKTKVRLKELNIKKIVSDTTNVQLMMKGNGYSYMNFRNGNDTIYILSTRVNNKPNCSFVDNNYFDQLEDFDTDKYFELTDNSDDFEYSLNLEEEERIIEVLKTPIL